MTSCSAILYYVTCVATIIFAITWLIDGMFPVGVVVGEDVVDLLTVIPVDVLYVGAKQSTTKSGVLRRRQPVVVLFFVDHRRVVGRDADQHGTRLEHGRDRPGPGHEVRRLERHRAALVHYRTDRRPVARRPQRRRPDDDSEQVGRHSLEALDKTCVTVTRGCRRRLATLPLTFATRGGGTVDGAVHRVGDIVSKTQRVVDHRPAG